MPTGHRSCDFIAICLPLNLQRKPSKETLCLLSNLQMRRKQGTTEINRQSGRYLFVVVVTLGLALRKRWEMEKVCAHEPRPIIVRKVSTNSVCTPIDQFFTVKTDRRIKSSQSSRETQDFRYVLGSTSFWHSRDKTHSREGSKWHSSHSKGRFNVSFR